VGIRKPDDEESAKPVHISRRIITSEAEMLILTCLNCGAEMDDQKCKLVCSCGYFASCSDYY